MDKQFLLGPALLITPVLVQVGSALFSLCQSYLHVAYFRHTFQHTFGIFSASSSLLGHLARTQTLPTLYLYRRDPCKFLFFERVVLTGPWRRSCSYEQLIMHVKSIIARNKSFINAISWIEHMLHFQKTENVRNGNWSEWSAHTRAARVRFEITNMISDQNCTPLSSVAT